ncbi:phage holin family protein [Nesterenkonia sp. HG001]|uniref:phage holin family protein n=1 Tax=Nesterenkonia sp. HG001 TaxID=2983207 RepID=UPI002AC3929B|nr:phage holin family protein [Nesterenkonia sp. HG001]MDZ5076521.1 hypothetical protein [Nesterenkonia sp. HG001]
MTTGPRERDQHTPSAAPSPTGASAGSPTRPAAPPPEPEDVDALLADSLKAQSEQEFAWREPERRPRWYERAEMERNSTSTSASPGAGVAAPASHRSRRTGGRMRVGQFIVGAICLMLALWCLASLVLGVVFDPLLVALAVCAVAGLALVGAGLRPKPGTRI